MAGYVSKFATGATIEAILDKANNSQSVSAAEKTTWNNKQNALTTAQLAAVNSGITIAEVYQIDTNTEDISDLKTTIGDINSILESVL